LGDLFAHFLGRFLDCREIFTVELERIDDWTIVSMINFLVSQNNLLSDITAEKNLTSETFGINLGEKKIIPRVLKDFLGYLSFPRTFWDF